MTDDATTDQDTTLDLNLRPGLIGSALAMAAAVTISVWGWTSVDGDQVPVHFDASGAPDRWGTRFEAFAVMPLVMAGVIALLAVLPRIDPRRSGIAKSIKAYNWVWVAVLAVMVAVHFMATRSAVADDGSGVEPRILVGVIGLMFLVIGNYLPKTGSNWFFGIRTPWTLSDDRVWTATHRLGGRLLMATGVLILVAATVTSGPVLVWIMLGLVLASVVGTTAYSFVLYRRLNPS